MKQTKLIQTQAIGKRDLVDSLGDYHVEVVVDIWDVGTAWVHYGYTKYYIDGYTI